MTAFSSKSEATSRREFLGLPLLVAGSSMAALRAAQAAIPDAPPLYITLPKPLPAVGFQSAKGAPLSLASFTGKFILLNVWATWCAPCRKEMPTLDGLQEKLGGSHFQVVPVSIDTGGLAAVRKFYQEIHIKHLGIYLDPSGGIMQSLLLEGLPTSFLINLESKQIGRLLGPAKWDSPDSLRFLRQVISGT
jgi:thiol-disulfide isomerase/thioredoxin